MSLLKPASNNISAAKIGLYGDAGSGKTRTAIEIAMGLARIESPKKPRKIAMFDTEGGSDFHEKRVKANGIDFVTAKFRSFEKLMAVMAEARKIGAVIVIDSISHVWADITQSYEKKMNRKKGLRIWDWGVIKPLWFTFTDEYLVTPCHAIVCGRSAAVYEDIYNEEKGEDEIKVVSHRMKVEKETGYEPSLLIEMEKRQQGGTGFDHVAVVVKDRADALDGFEVANPTFADFIPHFKALNIGGVHNPTDTKTDSQGLFSAHSFTVPFSTQVEILVEKTQAAFVLAGISMRNNAGKKQVVQLLEKHFKTTSWEELKTMKPGDLQEGLLGLTNDLASERKSKGSW